jgi:hypothetical protein
MFTQRGHGAVRAAASWDSLAVASRADLSGLLLVMLNPWRGTKADIQPMLDATTGTEDLVERILKDADASAWSTSTRWPNIPHGGPPL